MASLCKVILVTGLLGLFFLSCKHEDNAKQMKLAAYLALCPSGTSGCYNDCGTAVGGSITPANYYNYQTCTNTCDANCSLGFLLY